MTDVLAEARETSGATTGGLLRYVRAQAGDAAVAEVVRRAGVRAEPAELDDQSRWWSYDTRIRLFAAATEVLDDPDTMFKVGAAALHSGLAHALVILLRAMGSPRQVIRKLPRAVAKFSTTSTMEVVESGATSATIAFRLHEGYDHSRLDCRYAQGLLTTVPTVFGLPPAQIVHDECESDGFPVVHLPPDLGTPVPAPAPAHRRPHRRGRAQRPARAAAHPAVRGYRPRRQRRPRHGAAPHRRPGRRVGPRPRLPARRRRPGRRRPAGARRRRSRRPGRRPGRRPPRRGRNSATGAVVVDVASARRNHGRLAALYRDGADVMGGESSMLAAYAGHAAAALDLIMALEGARQEAERATALLELAHELSAATDAAAVNDIVSEALPRIVGCTSAGILLWDPATGSLRSQSSVGLTDDGRSRLQATQLRAEDVPELVGMLTAREPVILSSDTSSPVMRRLLEDVGTSDVVAVPLLADSTFLGVATAGWRRGEAPTRLDGDVLARLRGVGDQATTALQKARLLDTVRHQATHDALTGLPNRVLFLDTLERAIADARPDEPVAVLFCDLDRFKAVNDTLGHAAGDELLRQVSARLRAAVRPGDTVGRLSGDEFAVILAGITEASDAAGLAERVVACFDAPFRLDGSETAIGTSVGVAVHDPHEGIPAEELLRRADAAMYRHKERTPRPPPLAARGGTLRGATSDAR